jgi:hypothetical protein
MQPGAPYLDFEMWAFALRTNRITFVVRPNKAEQGALQ